MRPEDSVGIQASLGSDIAMALDECIENPAPRDYVRSSCERTTRWLRRCRDELARLGDGGMLQNPGQMLWGIGQGGTYADIRKEHVCRIAELDLPGYAIGGLAVGESAEVMYEIIEAVEPLMPGDRPRYLMGVGTPTNIIEAVARGVDFFDCVLPARNARHGHLYTREGCLNINNKKHELDDRPVEEGCECPTCKSHSRGYLRHLLKSGEVLGLRLCVAHNLYFYNRMMKEIREAIEEERFEAYRRAYAGVFDRRI